MHEKLRICTESTPARESSPEGSFVKDLFRNRRRIKNLECLIADRRSVRSIAIANAWGPCRACNGASVRFSRDAEDEPSWAPRFLDLVRRRPAMRERSMRDKMSGCEHVHRAGKGKWARDTCCADQNYEAYHLPQYLRRQSWLSTVAPSLLCSDWMD